ncbi:MAG: ribonuclease HII [Anaerolineae bacterium]
MRERVYQERRLKHVFGLDEAGRGPMAGPLVAAAVCLPLDDLDALTVALKGVKDSKKMTARQREAAYEAIQQTALAWGIGAVQAHEMVSIGNMTRVTHLAMQRALDSAFNETVTQAEALLVDYLHLPGYDDIPQESLTRGESLSLSIAAASVLAKVYRDRVMIAYAEQYPQYGFDQHKGYITASHKAALREYGACPIHRLNYAPVQQVKQGTFLERD